MPFPAARVGDMHVCPMVAPGLPPIPAVGGPVMPPCMVTVITMGMPQARALADMVMATPPTPPHPIAMGSPTVLVGNMMAARMMDVCTFGGPIVVGAPTVIIGP